MSKCCNVKYVIGALSLIVLIQVFTWYFHFLLVGSLLLPMSIPVVFISALATFVAFIVSVAVYYDFHGTGQKAKGKVFLYDS